MYSDSENARNFSKMSMLELKDSLARQETLIKNRGLLGILKDKGASVITARDRIQKEIDSRREIENIESRLGTMDLNKASSDQKVLQDKHIQYVCAKEKPTVNSKYRPYQSLTHSKANAEPTADASLEIAFTEKVAAVKSMKTTAVEVTAACEPKMVHEPAIVIPLSESLVIQDEQSHKLKEERLKRFMRFRERTDSGSEDDGSPSYQSEEES